MPFKWFNLMKGDFTTGGWAPTDDNFIAPSNRTLGVVGWGRHLGIRP